MGGIVPCSGDEEELGERGEDHDDGRDGAPQCGDGEPEREVGGGVPFRARVDGRGVPGGVEPEDGDVDDPDSVEVDEELEEGAFLDVRFEERAIPVHLIESHEPLRRGEVDEARLKINMGVASVLALGNDCGSEALRDP